MKCLSSAAAAAVLVTFSSLPVSASAWGNEGHQLIAVIAEERLTTVARAEVHRLLQIERSATLASVASWADDVRNRETARWHYVNFRRELGCRFDAKSMCAGGDCVVAAIERQAELLASSATDEARLHALKYLVHFVGDVHQPLHAGHADDKGGNTFQLQAYGRGTNLHALWDTGLLQHWPGGVSALRVDVEREQIADDLVVSPTAWAEESCRIVESGGFYPNTHTLDPTYSQRWNVVVTRRIAAAAHRLASTLNRSLARRQAQRPPASTAQ